MKTTIALSLFLAATLAASADYEDLHADPERGIVRLPGTHYSDGKEATTYLNVSQIVRMTIKSEKKGPDARSTLIIVSSEVDPSKPTDNKHVTYEIQFPTRQMAEAAIEKMFAKRADQAGGLQRVVHPPRRSGSKPEGEQAAPPHGDKPSN